MKKLFSIILAMIFVFGSFGIIANAQNDVKLTFNDEGKFNILHVCDCQDGYPAHEEMFNYINYVLDNYDIDLVVLGGDNTVGPKETKYEAIEELVKPYIDHQVYFTMVFGNHDHQQDVDKPELFEMYKKAGGEYFLGFNEDKEDSTKIGTHFLPVYAKDSDDIKYGLYMFDSGNYVYDENGEELGYDSVDEDQIEWYRNKRDALKEETGDYVPSVAFQHIVVGDVYDSLFFESAVDLGVLGANYNGKYYTYVPKLNNFSGFVNEPPCPGYYNRGQLDAIAEKGDMKAIYSGHDHTNDYDVEIKGVHVANTPGVTYNSYSSEVNHGARLITLSEDGSYTDSLITINSIAKDNADFAESVGTSTAKAAMYEFLAKFALIIGKVFSVFGYIFK